MVPMSLPGKLSIRQPGWQAQGLAHKAPLFFGQLEKGGFVPGLGLEVFNSCPEQTERQLRRRVLPDCGFPLGKPFVESCTVKRARRQSGQVADEGGAQLCNCVMRGVKRGNFLQSAVPNVGRAELAENCPDRCVGNR